jgi:hypothetical protein
MNETTVMACRRVCGVVVSGVAMPLALIIAVQRHEWSLAFKGVARFRDERALDGHIALITDPSQCKCGLGMWLNRRKCSQRLIAAYCVENKSLKIQTG